MTAYILVFLHASLAAFRLNVGFAHAQNIIQVSESAQAQKKPKIPLAPAEQARLALDKQRDDVLKAMSKARIHLKGDERILGESDFVKKVLSGQEEKFNRRYWLRAKGYDIEKVVKRKFSQS